MSPLANRENCEADTVDLLFTDILTDEESMSFPRPFCLVQLALIAIASELVQRRAQVSGAARMPSFMASGAPLTTMAAAR